MSFKSSILFNKQLSKWHLMQNVAHKSVLSTALLYASASALILLNRSIRKVKNLLDKDAKPLLPENIPKDTVILYQFPRNVSAPSISPFALKLETWLRMADIKYQNNLYGKVSSKGQIPWIKLNGQVIEDSQLSIEYLTRVYNKDLNAHLTPYQKAVSRAILKMNDESLKWIMALHRFWHSNNKKELNLPRLAYWIMGYRVYKGAYGQGYARFKADEFYDIGRKDLKALNDIVGSKKYVLTEDRPSEIDAAVFGMCVQYIYCDLGPMNQFIKSECPNLIRYVETMKQEFWKDWDQNLAKKKVQQKQRNLLSLFKK